MWTEHEPTPKYIVPGETVIHPAEMVFGGGNPQPSSWATIYVKPKLFEQIAAEFENPDRVEVIPSAGFRDPQIERLTLALESDMRSGYGCGRVFGESVGAALAAHLLANYVVKPFKPRWYRGGMSKYVLSRTLDYIKGNIGADLRLAELAEVAQMSPWHFCRMFKQSTGLSPHQYLMRERIETAKRLLAGRNSNIEEIARELGFTDRSHFITMFKRYNGCTPREYINRL